MRGFSLLLLLLPAGICFSQSKKPAAYFPPPSSWQHKPAVEFFDTALLTKAISFARINESKTPRDLEQAHLQSFGREPLGYGVGPFGSRGAQTGLIIHKGYIVAEWGNPSDVEMTFSVTKSFLSTVIGLAVDKGLIRHVHDTVSKYMPPVEWYDPLLTYDTAGWKKKNLIFPFASGHNKILTWDNMLRQTSDWEGELWGKQDWADRPDRDSAKWHNRERNKPGTVYEYNDVRVNALALAATNVWRKPLPQVLKEYIMDPIGASSSWRWFGYQNSWIVMDGQAIQSVSGGGHWGGGMFINAYDMARFGLLTLNKGNWNGKQLLSKQWINQALSPTQPQPTYGYMNFFINTDKKLLASAPATSFVHVGNGANLVYVDPGHDLVMVLRWIEYRHLNEMIALTLAALKKK